MNKNSHQRKIRMARQMRSQAECSRKISVKDKAITYSYKNIFDTKAWEDRKQAIKDRVIRNIVKVKARKAKRLAKINV